MKEEEIRHEATREAFQKVHLWLRDHARIQYEREVSPLDSKPEFSQWAAARLERDYAPWADSAWLELVSRSRQEGAKIALAEARKVAALKPGAVDEVLERIAEVCRNIRAYGLSLMSRD